MNTLPMDIQKNIQSITDSLVEMNNQLEQLKTENERLRQLVLDQEKKFLKLDENNSKDENHKFYLCLEIISEIKDEAIFTNCLIKFLSKSGNRGLSILLSKMIEYLEDGQYQQVVQCYRALTNIIIPIENDVRTLFINFIEAVFEKRYEELEDMDFMFFHTIALMQAVNETSWGFSVEEYITSEFKSLSKIVLDTNSPEIILEFFIILLIYDYRLELGQIFNVLLKE